MYVKRTQTYLFNPRCIKSGFHCFITSPEDTHTQDCSYLQQLSYYRAFIKRADLYALVRYCNVF